MSHWHPVCHESEVAKDGDYVCWPWQVEGLVAVTNFGGRIVAWDNRCPHRGARIYDETVGNKPPVCAYHGRCAKADAVNQFELKVVAGFIFVCDGEPGKFSFDGLLPPLEPLKLHTSYAFPMDCHWTVAVENALDLEHVVTVHSNSLAFLKLHRKELSRYPDGSSQETFYSGLSRRLSKLAALSRPLASASEDYAHTHLFPYSCVSSTKGLAVNLQNYFPMADGRTLFVHRMYVPETTVRDISHHYTAAAELNRKVFEEDAAVCALVEPWYPTKWSLKEDRLEHFRKFAERLEA